MTAPGPEAVLIDSLERYLMIEEVIGIPPAGDGFDGCRCDCVATEAEIDERADRLREAWNLGMDPVPSLCALLEEKGIKVVEADLPERISGMACRAMRQGRVVADAVVVSTRTTVERKRFTLAHELAHKIIRSTGNPDITLERAMDRFAGAFLVPARDLLEKVGGEAPSGDVLRDRAAQACVWGVGGGDAGSAWAGGGARGFGGSAGVCDVCAGLVDDGAGADGR